MAKRKENGATDISDGVEHLIEAVDRSFPKQFTPGLSIHSILELTTEVSDRLKNSESRAVSAEYGRLFNEIQAALPIDKKHLISRFDETVGQRLCHEEIVPLTAGLIAGLRIAGISKPKTAMIAKKRLASIAS